ncbi:hypothetical protein JNM87_06895 [Candidatus Saccharibacteria bacterium]|nr:hypothetical protein [Candidatus Saccharibacteria bacterium]
MANDLLSRPDQDSDSLERLFAAPSAKTSGSDIAARNKEIQQLESQFNSSPSASGQALSNKHPLRRSRGASRPTPVRRSRLLSQPPAGTSEPEQPQVTPQTTPDQDSGRDVYDQPGFDSDLHSDPLSAPDSDTRNSDEKQENGSQALDSGDLKKREDNPESEYGPSAKDDLQRRHDEARERLGLGYTGDPDELPDDMRKRNKGYRSKSRLKQRLAIASAVGGGGIAAGIIAFMLLMPLKIHSFVALIQGEASAAAVNAMQKQTGNMLSDYMRHSVIAALNKPGCQSTIDPGCVVVSRGTNPVSKLYAAWSQDKMQQKLATKYGIVMGYDSSAKRYYMSIGGHLSDPAQFEEFRNGTRSLYDMDMKGMSRAKVRYTIMNAFENETLWKRVYHRYTYGKLLEKRFHIKRCVIACDVRDKFNDSKDAKLLAGKAFLAQKVAGVVSESYGLLIDCMLDIDLCSSKIEVGTNETSEPKSAFQRNLDDKLNAYIAAHGVAKLSTIIERSKGIKELGISGYMTKQIASRIALKLGGEGIEELTGKVTTKIIGKAVPVIGWVSLAITVKHFLQVFPGVMEGVVYGMNSQAAVALFATYQSHDSEIISSHTDLIESGALADTLSEDQDMTSHPVYGRLTGTTVAGSGGFTDTIANLLSSPAYAATPTSGIFKCDNGKPVAADKELCTEEPLTAMSDVATKIQYGLDSPIYKAMFTPTLFDPILNVLNDAYNWLLGIPSEIVVKGLMALCIGPCDSALQTLAAKGAELLQWFVSFIKPNPFEKLSGGRIMAMSTAGARVGYQKSSMLDLGAGPSTAARYVEIQNERIAYEKYDFESKSFIGRVIDTDTPYSLVSQVALNTRGPSYVADGTVATLLSNPFGKLAVAFSGVMPTQSAFAQPTTTSPSATSDEFGIKYFVYEDRDIPLESEKYWDDHCEGRDFKSEFYSSMKEDKPTGEAVATRSEPCMLIEKALVAAGAKYDAQFIPADSDNEVAGGSISGIATGSTIELAKQINDSPNISFQTSQGEAYFQDIVRTGRQDSCGGNTIDPRLLGTILALSQKYKLVLGVFIDGHSCNNGYHPRGMAVDINGVNPLSGEGGTGNRIEWVASEQTILRQFFIDASSLLSQGGGGGLGQQQCIAGAPPKMPANVSLFVDTCNHIHMDVGVR